jgi:amino acid adenylation domain-containing protein
MHISAPALPLSPSESIGRQPIAVIGMGCRFPGAASVAELWELLRNGVDATSDTPMDRYDINALYSPVPRIGKVISRRAGYLHDIDQFDAAFFGLSDNAAKYLDPQQRLLMMTAWEALEDAGVPPERIAGSRTGVYVGAEYTDYADLIARQGLTAIDLSALFNFRSLLSGRLSFLFDLHGPSICLDTACSSSLVAAHLACQSLRAGETTLALVAGVNLKLVPDRDVLLSRARVLAPDGRCKFGAATADGAAFSDGVGVVVLKPLDRALADGDRVRALILGSAVSNDGASSGTLLTPSVEGHAEMLRWAYHDAGVDPADVDFVEAHGTGTQMIDRVEFAGLNEVLCRNRPNDRPCFVGSIKTNIGHTEGAAGVAALIKTILCLENRQIVPSLHFQTPNPNISWDNILLVVPTKLHPVPDRERPLIAGVSGQGISCVNAHLVIRQADAAWNATRLPAMLERPHLLVLSARTLAALEDLALAYIGYLQPGGSGYDLGLRDICYSAAIRRQHHAHRLAIIAPNHQTLISKLRSFLVREYVDGVSASSWPDRSQSEQYVTMGYPDRPKTPAALSGESQLVVRIERLAHLYTRAQPVDWDAFVEPGGRFVALPTYPWQKSRYWLDSSAENSHRPERVAEVIDLSAKSHPEAVMSDPLGDLVGHSRTLLETIAANPNTRMSQLPLETAECERCATESNPTDTEFSRDATIIDLFERQVALTPESAAVISERCALTYAELDQRANGLALFLQTRGVRKGGFVGLCVSRSIEQVVAILAILKTGAAYVPLDSAYPAERLAFMLEDSAARVLLTQSALANSLRSHCAEIVCLDKIECASASRDDKPGEGPMAESPAYLIYTSGSTGKPKGVLMPHRPLVNLLEWQREVLPEAARTIQFAPVSFDVSFQEIFSTWCAGGTLLLIDEKLRRDPIQLWRFIAEERVERLFVPFVALQSLAEAVTAPCALRDVITAGEPLRSTPQIRRMFKTLKGCRLHNHYGPSETHVVTSYTLPVDPDDWQALPPIGRPITNTKILLLADEGQPNATGELYIGGECLCHGYLNRPELTAEKFVNLDRGRFYKSGDVARWLPGGNLEFLGRTDGQVKVRGYRVELGEIEAVLSEYPSIRDVAVVVKPDPADDNRLIAYAVSEPESSANALREYARSKLPEYSVPSLFIRIDRLPLTPSGKTDRRALPDPIDVASNAVSVAPRDSAEQELVAIWQRALNLPSVGVVDDFFELGGDSLIAVRVFMEIEKTFRTRLPLATLFEGPTIEKLASALRKED